MQRLFKSIACLACVLALGLAPIGCSQQKCGDAQVKCAKPCAQPCGKPCCAKAGDKPCCAKPGDKQCCKPQGEAPKDGQKADSTMKQCPPDCQKPCCKKA